MVGGRWQIAHAMCEGNCAEAALDGRKAVLLDLGADELSDDTGDRRQPGAWPCCAPVDENVKVRRVSFYGAGGIGADAWRKQIDELAIVVIHWNRPWHATIVAHFTTQQAARQ